MIDGDNLPVGFHPCSRCHGTKVIHAVVGSGRIADPRTDVWTEPCPECGGSGIEPDEYPDEPEAAG